MGYSPGLSAIVMAATLAGCATPGVHQGTGQAATVIASFVYRCESGRIIEAAYRADGTAAVRYAEQTHLMHVAVSGSGARYVGDGLEWWTKGTGAGAPGTLLRHSADDTTGAVIESCVQKQGRSP
ncbi:MliC family protein [Rhodoferax sediminis]|nr:MliC family protein [Rhodoferax sediminis]